jgi:predicted SAM-dependent methyltransferase
MSQYRPNIIDHSCVTDEARKSWFDESTFPVRVNLGCGVDYIEGYINVDGNPKVKANVHIDLDNPYIKFPWDNGSVNLFYCSHVLEHIRHLVELKAEMIRCLEPGGVIVVVAPNFDSLDAWGDDTHCRAFTVHSFFPDYWPGCKNQRVAFLELKDSLGNDIKWLFGIMVKESGEISV